MAKRNDNNEELETAFQVFMRNYKNVPGFRALVKLGLWALLFITIIVVASLGGNSTNENRNIQESTKEVSLTYKDILDKYNNDNVTLKVTLKKDDITKLLDVKKENNYLSGIYETNDAVVKFIIKDKDVYEIKMNE